MRSATAKLSPHPGPLPSRCDDATARRVGKGEGESSTDSSRRKPRGKICRKDPVIEPENRRSRQGAEHQSKAHDFPCQAQPSQTPQDRSSAIQQIKNLRSDGRRKRDSQDAAVDLLILSDGTILIHNLTPAMAAILNEINPKDQTIQWRTFAKRR